MNPLYDQNLPPSLVRRLSDILPSGIHVRELGMSMATDFDIWQYAKKNSFTIYSKDSDFQSLALVKGHPPKSIRLGVGNASVIEIVDFIRLRIEAIRRFESDPYESHLELR